MSDRRLLFAVDHRDLARAVEVALAVRSTQPQLAVRVEIPRRNRDVAGRFDHQQIGRGAGLEFEAIGRAAGNDDVIEIAKGQRAEHRVQHAPAGMDEDDLVGVGVAEKLLLGLRGPAARERSRRRCQAERSRPEIGSPARGIGPGLHVVMAEHGLIARARWSTVPAGSIRITRVGGRRW